MLRYEKEKGSPSIIAVSGKRARPVQTVDVKKPPGSRRTAPYAFFKLVSLALRAA
jgi:hypothetical protein